MPKKEFWFWIRENFLLVRWFWSSYLYLPLIFSGVIKRQHLLGGQNACHLYNLVKICCTPLGMHTRKINLEIKKCIFKGETPFSHLLNPIVLIFWTLKSRTLKQRQLDCPLRCADAYRESWSFRTLSFEHCLYHTDRFFW